MNKKTIYTLLLIISALILNSNSVNAVTAVPQKSLTDTINVEKITSDDEEINIIKRFSFKDRFSKSPEAQIKDFYKKYDKYSSKNNIEKLKEMYSESFVNNDGFNKEVLFKMVEEASDAYDNLEYTTNIDKIIVNGNYATVVGHEITNGQTTKINENTGSTGLISSEIYYTNYMRKESNKWKIIASDITSECIALKYGEAKNMPIEITAPEKIASGTEYEITVTTSAPPESFLVGSIVNEPIVFPVTQAKDVYRTIKSDELARVVKSNENNKNEYATVTIAITRAQLEPPSVVVKMTGMAFVMKRVNVIKVNENI